MGNVNQEWLDSLNLVNELGKKLEPSFVNDSWNIIYGTIKQRFGDSFKSGLVIDPMPQLPATFRAALTMWHHSGCVLACVSH